MVCINTYYSRIQFKHFVDVPSSDCVIGTAQDDGQKLRLFLIVNDSGPIYKRNGLNNTWEEVEREHRDAVRQLVHTALRDRKIPRYTTDSLSILN